MGEGEAAYWDAEVPDIVLEVEAAAGEILLLESYKLPNRAKIIWWDRRLRRRYRPSRFWED